MSSSIKANITVMRAFAAVVAVAVAVVVVVVVVVVLLVHRSLHMVTFYMSSLKDHKFTLKI